MAIVRTVSLVVTSLLVQSISPATLCAQASKFEGAWKHVGGTVVTPDSSYEVRPLIGLVVIHGRYFSQTWGPALVGGVEQTSDPQDAAAKAMRYDAISANAGIHEAREQSFTAQYLQSKNPALVGHAVTYTYRFHGDTLFTTRTDTIAGDANKMRRSSLVFVRLPPGRPSALDGAWRHLGTDVVTPDTSFHEPALRGLGVIDRGYLSQTWAPVPPNGVEQAGAPGSVDAKARRYDALIANSGKIDVHDTTFEVHWLQGKDPSLAGRSLTYQYRMRGDTLFAAYSYPWEKDETKTARVSYVFVRDR